MFGPNFILMPLMFGGGGVYQYDVDIKSVESVKSVKGSSWVQAAEVWSSVCSRIFAQVPVGILAELTAKKFQAALAFPIFSNLFHLSFEWFQYISMCFAHVLH